MIKKYVFIMSLAAMTIRVNSYSQETDTLKSGALENLSLKELLDVKVTSASKTSQELETAPATVTVITKEQIRSRGYQSLLDVMYDLPDMKVDDKIYSGIRNTFTLRGTQGQEKFILLLDGIRISSPSGEAMPIMENYPVNLAEQIEILYGPASALYGADAVSGVINIITKKPRSKEITVDASSIAGTNGYTNTSLFISKKLGEHASLIVSGQYSYDQGFDYSKLYKNDSLENVSSYSTGTVNTIYGPMTPAKPITPKYEAPMEAYNVYAALHVNDFTFSYFRNDFTVPSSFGNNTNNAIYNKDVFLKQSIDVLNASYKKSLGKVTSTTALTGSEYNLDPNSNYRNLYTSMEPAYKYSTCSKMKVEQQLDFRASDKLSITGGGAYESYSSIPQSADLENPVDPKDDYIHAVYLGTQSYYKPEGLPAQFYIIKYNNIGAYIQAQYSPVKKIHITLGARYDVNSRYGSTFNPRLGFVYKPFNKTTIKALYGSAFLAPSPSDSYAQYGSFYTQDSGKTYHSYFLHLPNPNLKPVISHNVELSMHQYLTDNFSVTLDGYYTYIKGLHEFADDNQSTHLYNNMFNGIPVDYVEVFVNEGRQENYGGSIQLNLKHSFGRIRFNSYASLSYTNGNVSGAPSEAAETVPDAQLEFISSFISHIGTDIKIGKFTCSPRLILVGRQNITGIADTTADLLKRQTIPGYALLNISVRYTIVKQFSVFMNVTNALNQDYRNVSFNMDLNNKNTDTFYGQHQDPIRIMGGINFTF